MSTTHLVTAEELLEMGGDARFELIEGVLKEVSPSGVRPGAIGARILIYMGQFVLERNIGHTTNADAGYILSDNPATVAAPDVGYFRRDRYPGEMPAKGFYPMPPDLAVEVISPSDERADIERKQQLYERAGVPLVWWVDPEERTVSVHRPGQKMVILDESAMLDGGDVLPGFELPLRSIFAV